MAWQDRLATIRAFALAVGLAVGALLALPPAALAQFADPGPEWHTASSAHFRVHYRAAQRAQAEAVAAAAERAWPRVTEALKWEIRSRVEVVVYTELDLANGFTTPLPYNIIGVFLTPPDEGQLLDNSAWLDLLMVHEFTHAVHMDKMRGAPLWLQRIFGRNLWWVPNLFNPGWVLEGVAVYQESDAASGRGRLKGPMFESWLRAERKAGFIKLAELNADGRALPIAKQYLYGAYFFEFLDRRYGLDKPQQMVEFYSGNAPFVPRLHTAPRGATGKTMDVLWDEFLADLAQQVDERAAPFTRMPEVAGRRALGPMFELPSIAALPSGAVLAVVDDGVGATTIERIARDGSRQRLAKAKYGARLEVGADGRALVAQVDICDTYYFAYDLYRLEGSSLSRLTRCAHLRRAVDTPGGIVAIQLEGGRTRIVRLPSDGNGTPGSLYQPPEGTDIIDIAASPDGRKLAAVVRDAGDWRLVEFDLGSPGAAPVVRLKRNAPMSNLRWGRSGLEMVANEGTTMNVWRLAGGELQRLTNSHTGIVAHGGSAADGSLAVVGVVSQGYDLRWLEGPLQVLEAQAARGAGEVLAAGRAGTAAGTAQGGTGVSGQPGSSVLGPGSSYSAWRTLYPRSWFPASFADRGLTAYGASTNGADAVGWHQYFAYAMYETTQKEMLGGLEYIWRGAHGLAVDRTLVARAWTGPDGDETTTLYDRHLQAQWITLVPVPYLNGLHHRVTLGIGAALDRVERVQVQSNASASRQQDERLVAILADYDSRGSNWYSDGVNRGLKVTLRAESYKPFETRSTDNAPDYNGTVGRADAKAYFGIGRGALALRWTEVRAKDRVVPTQLGGATELGKAIGFNLGNRELALRGYKGDEAPLLGREARLASVEARFPMVDIDRHGMVPPFGINRLSGTVFFDVGGAWDTGDRPMKYYRGTGFELRGETKLLYVLGLDLRLGVARALDEIVPGRSRTRGYLTVGQSF